MNTEYAYLGEVTPQEFKEIRKGFPNVVGIDIYTNPDGSDADETLIVLGISKEFSDEVIGIHQLIISLWGNEEGRSRCFDAISY